MLGWSALGARFAVLGTSAALHAGLGVAFAYVGHGAPASAAAPSEIAIEVVDAPPPVPVAEEPIAEPKDEDEEAHHAAHSHTHPYPVPPSHDATPHDPSIVHAPIGALPPQGDPAPAPDVVAAPAAPVRFTMNLGKAAVATGGASSPVGTGSGDGAPAEIVPESSVAAPAHLVYGPPPPYPSAARAAEIEADVPLEIVVDARGTVIDARVTHAAGYGLDDAAVRAVRAYRFAPARRGDHPVAVRMRWSMEFRLR